MINFFFFFFFLFLQHRPLNEVDQLEMEFIRTFPVYLEQYQDSQNHKQGLEMMMYQQLLPVTIELIHAKFERPTTKQKAQSYIKSRNQYIKDLMKKLGGTKDTNKVIIRKLKKNDPWTLYINSLTDEASCC
ncbi:uncharacterized protein BX664DRAFT_85812 [Halteromyces radiatus]|uniref:uncharacterized protein n=1 Tax=Halteromyces radiatus TaxID=101107 RepID=UPI00222025D7|nr:uncharacterized protein BX664DRAFT_85812 [Halteromyces radiatus]KAI8097729.1 hypothetical protein BX664DRAFT_85812 [Halteromyces radiatus]